MGIKRSETYMLVFVEGYGNLEGYGEGIKGVNSPTSLPYPPVIQLGKGS
jgi:hypothetical protein